MACIFRLSKCLKNKNVENGIFERSAARQNMENYGRFPRAVAPIGGGVTLMGFVHIFI